MDRIIRIRLDARQAEQGIDRLDNDMRGLGRTSDGIQTKLTAVASALAAAFSVQQITAYADAYTNIQNRLRVVTDSTEQLTRVTASLLQTANDTRASFDATSSLYSTLARSTEELAISEERLIAITKTVNQSFAVSGATADEAANAIRQLSQGLAAGALRGDEFNSVAEQAPGILRAVAAETGKSVGQLREFAAEGGITAELLIRAIENYSDVVQSEFEKTNRTFQQSAVVAKNNATAFVGSSKLVQGATEAAGNALVNFSENLETASQAIVAITAVIAGRYAAGLVAANAAAIQLAVGVATGNASLITGAKAAAGKAAAMVQSAAADVAAAEAALVSAAAERARFVAVQTSIKADLELETVRLRAQISDIGRQQSIQRLTALRLELAAATTGLARAEAAQAAAAKVADAANLTSVDSLNKLDEANKKASLSSRAFSGAMALVGGPVGAAILAAGGLAFFVTQAISSQREAERLANTARGLNSELEKTNKIYENYQKTQRSAAEQALTGLGQPELQAQFSKSSALIEIYKKRIDDLKQAGASYARIAEVEEKLKQEQLTLDAINKTSPQTAKGTQDLALKLGDLAAQVNLTSIEYSVFAERQRLIKDGFGTAEIDRYIESYRALLLLQEDGRAKAKTGSDIDSLFSGSDNLFSGSRPDDSGQSDESTNRINERIAALKLETQTLGSELSLQQGIRQGFISQEQAQLDLQTANKIQQAVTERELLLAEKTITEQQRLETESAFNANLIAITQSYEEQKTEIARQQALTRMQIESDTQQTYLETTQIALGALTDLLGGSTGAVKALKLLQAGANAFQIYAASETAAALILATPPGPVLNPSLIGLANAVRIKGKISAGAVLAAGAASTFGGGGSSGSFSGGGGGPSTPATLPTQPQAAQTVQTLEIRGLDEIRDELRNQDGMVSTRFVATILDKISDANRIRGEG